MEKSTTRTVSKFTGPALWYGALALLVPAYGFFNATSLSQADFLESQVEDNRISWALSEASPIDGELALSRAHTCRVAGKKVAGEWVHAETVFNRNFNFDADNAAFNEGRFLCALDGSIVQIANGSPKDPVQVSPEDMDEYHQILIETHNVPVDSILNFKKTLEDKE